MNRIRGKNSIQVIYLSFISTKHHTIYLALTIEDPFNYDISDLMLNSKPSTA